MTSPVFIVVEGLDGSGKSTLAAGLAAQLGAELWSTPPAQLREVRPALDALYRGDGMAATLFYASTVAFASTQVAAALAAGRSVVMDRYWLSTKVYSEVIRATPPPPIEAALRAPDLTIFLDVDAEERHRRLLSRGMTPADRDTLGRDEALRSAYLASAATPIAGRFRVLPGSGATAAAIVSTAARWALEGEATTSPHSSITLD